MVFPMGRLAILVAGLSSKLSSALLVGLSVALPDREFGIGVVLREEGIW
jgi:hypothetical protein